MDANSRMNTVWLTGQGMQHTHVDTNPVELLLNRFQGLIRSVAGRYSQTSGFDEAYQEGCLSFLIAVKTYDVTVGPFPAYAARKVRGDVHTATRRVWRTMDRRQSVLAYEDETMNEAIDRMRVDSIGSEENQGMRDDIATWMQMTDLSQLIARVRFSDREALWLRLFLAGYRQEEIARRASVSTETVKTWRKRTLQKLRSVARNMDVGMRDFR